MRFIRLKTSKPTAPQQEWDLQHKRNLYRKKSIEKVSKHKKKGTKK